MASSVSASSRGSGVLLSTRSAGPPKPPRRGSSAAPSAAGVGGAEDTGVLTEGLQKSISAVRAAESSVKGQLVEYARRLETRVDVAHRSEERLSEEIRERTKELLEAQVTLKACRSEIKGQRASSAADAEYRNTLLLEIAKVNETVVSMKDEQRGLKDELQQARDKLQARHAELQQARDELRARCEAKSAARLHEEDLEERLAGLREMETTLQTQLVDTQAALRKQLGVARAALQDGHAELAEAREELSRNERDLRGELAQVQARLGATKAELQRRQKCCFRLRSKKAAAPKEAPAVLDC